MLPTPIREPLKRYPWIHSAFLRRTIFIVAVCLPACQRPAVVGPDQDNFIAPSEEGIGLDMVNAAFRVDGETKSDRINLSTDRFAFLFVFIKSKGLYVVSTEKVDGAVVAGTFAGSRLTFLASGTRIEFESKQGHLLDDRLDRDAWVEYFPAYDMLGPDAAPDEAVVGLARNKNLIPGFRDQN